MDMGVVERTATLITTSVSLVAGLAWSDFMKSLFAPGGPLAFTASYGQLAYAVLVTIFAVTVSNAINTWSIKQRNKQRAKEMLAAAAAGTTSAPVGGSK